MWYFILPAAALALAAGGYLLATSGSRIVVYQRGVYAASDVVRDYLPSGWQAVEVATASDVLAVIAEHDRISRFVILAHGGPDWILDRALTPERLAAALAPRLTWWAVVGLGGCSSGRSPLEPDSWGSPHIYRDGGADSYGGQLRDWLARYGAPRLVELRTHSIYGHTTANPAGRTFYVSEPGAPGRTIKPVDVSNEQWVATFQGVAATEWVMGLE